jgi:hypothetical protein
MAVLTRELRKKLESTVIEARRAGEAGARKALDQIAVKEKDPWSGMTPEQKKLRNQLRAHGRQLGDKRDEKRETQTIDRLAQECAYEHWHRMLFARFLAENDLLRFEIGPGNFVPISLSECQELAREKNSDWLSLASQYAVTMLPQIFRAGDPVLEVTLPPETRQALQGLLESLPPEVFAAEDSLGWVYQFWQTEQKEKVNKSEKKIGADELAAVTQLFTEDYMVLFLLHNTLGAWWAGKVLADKAEIASQAKDEDELRAACSVGGYEWTYLRFVREGDKAPWDPAAGTFDGWPRVARDLKVLDPCEGSGHFLVFALPILVAFRMHEEGLSQGQAVDAVLRDNLYGLELDNRCTQIAAFNLALAAWRMVGYRTLAPLNIACSGLGINAKEEDWARLAGGDERLRETMKRLYHLFEQAPILGSLIDPKRVGGTLFVAEFEKVWPLLEEALAIEQREETTSELAVTAQGLFRAARMLADEFTLVATNVPYLGGGKQDDVLKDYCEEHHTAAKADLATCFVDRCLSFCREGGSVALVTPQNWLFLTSYRKLRERLLKHVQWDLVARLGEHAFDSSAAAGAFAAMVGLTRRGPSPGHALAGWDVTEAKTSGDKANSIKASVACVSQSQQLTNPDMRIALNEICPGTLLSTYANAYWGQGTGDFVRFGRFFWEVPQVSAEYEFMQSTTLSTHHWSGREWLVFWQQGRGQLTKLAEELRGRLKNIHCRGREAWGRLGVTVSLMRDLPVTLYGGQIFDGNCAAITPPDPNHLPAIWAFCESPEFTASVRLIDQKINVSNHTLLKVPFDLTHWQRIAAQKYPDGLPKPHSSDPTQWLFSGHPKGSCYPLQVAVARVLSYRWPRRTGSSFKDCPAVDPDGLEKHADDGGIVCLSPIKGELPACDRLRAFLANAFGKEWSGGKQAELLSLVGYDGETIEDWLRDGFFQQHCELFHQRPFIWHIWDGLKDGFHALVNYHKLAAPKGDGRRTLEKLIYTYLGDWIEAQRAEAKKGVGGADARLAAAVHLKKELENILKGEVPYDIFVRWKPLHEQPVGWEPDINDGVRMNIRPFMTAKPLNGRGRNACILRVTPNIKWDKDRGKEPPQPKKDFPWFWKWDGSTDDFEGGSEFDGNRWNDLHYSRAFKQAARDCVGKQSAASEREKSLGATEARRQRG